jgi:rubrerythrin
MTNGEQVTGARDEHYDLVSVLYHTMQEASTLQTYIEDARSAGDNDLASFFEEVQEQDRQRTERAKELLGRKLS